MLQIGGHRAVKGLRLSTKVGAKAADLRVEGKKFQMLECKINRMSVLSKNL
jgi:hypothetical protein